MDTLTANIPVPRLPISLSDDEQTILGILDSVPTSVATEPYIIRITEYSQTNVVRILKSLEERYLISVYESIYGRYFTATSLGIIILRQNLQPSSVVASTMPIPCSENQARKRQQVRVSPGQYRVLQAIAKLSGAGDPHQAEVARVAAYSTRQVQRLLVELEAQKLVRSYRQGSHKKMALEEAGREILRNKSKYVFPPSKIEQITQPLTNEQIELLNVVKDITRTYSLGIRELLPALHSLADLLGKTANA